MKNPFRKSRLTDHTLRAMREIGDPHTRVIVSLGKRRALVYLTAEPYDTWTDKDGKKHRLFNVPALPPIEGCMCSQCTAHGSVLADL